MNYINDLEKIKNKLLNTKAIKPQYQLLAYKRVLEKFQDFQSKKLGFSAPQNTLDLDVELEALALGLFNETSTFGDLENKINK